MSEFEKNLANVMGSFIETELDFIENSHNEIEELKSENAKLRIQISAREEVVDKLQLALLDIKEYTEATLKISNDYVEIALARHILNIVNKALGVDNNEN